MSEVRDLQVLEGGADQPRAVLKSLTMIGWKSFAPKTYLEFAPGITAIVGPNGAGKSNVAEAIKWALGEGSAKQLRAKKSEDLIFAGSETRRAIGMAEVVLHLDNTAKRLPIDFSEVEIARRFYRSNESEYLLNRAKVRLRDLLDLLAAANLADNPFVVIGQGLVDQVLALRPQERRVVIEEAAGTRRLHLRREEALGKIAAAEAELVRVHDVLREITPRRQLLEEQAAKWRDYEGVRAELRRRALRWYRDSYESSAATRDGLGARLATIDAELERLGEAARRAESAALVDEEGVAYAREAEERAMAEAQAALEATSASREERAGLRSSAAALREQEERLRAALATLPAEIAELRGRRERVETELDESAELSRRVAAQRADTERDLAQRQAAADAAAAKRVAADREVVLREGTSAAARAEIDALARRDAALDTDASTLRENRAHGERAVERAAEDVADARREIDDLARRIEELAEQVGARRADTHRLGGDLALLRGQRSALADALDRARDELELRRRALASERPALPEGLWWLFDRVRVPSDVERAVRAVVGGRVAVGPLESARALRDAGARDVTVVVERGKDLPRGERFGVPLADLLEPLDAAAGAVARAALANVWLVEDEARALAGAKELPAGARLVTREGLLVQRGAARIAADAADELAARRRLAQVEEVVQRLGREAESAARAVAEADAQRERALADLAASERLLAEAEDGRREAERRLAGLASDAAAARDTVRGLEARLAALDRERADLHARRDTIGRERDEREAESVDAAQAVAHAEAAEREAASALRQAEGSASRIRLQAATADERRTTLARLRGALDDHIRAAERRRDVEQSRAETLATQRRDAGERLARLDADGARFEARAEGARRTAADARARARAAEGSRRESEQRVAASRERMTELRVERARVSAEQDRASAGLQLLDEQVRAELGLSEEDPLPDPSTVEIEEEDGRAAADAQRELNRLRRKLIALEPVNPLAETELSEVAERHDFLTSQRQDLETAIADLRTLSDDLARTIAEQFSATLQAVDREFAQFFARLFNGGTASLRISEDEEGGIDIVARPPGKRISALPQLSGGERALTATALLLAILRVRPSPFCVLDEVDAALDERNIGRFIQAVRELSDRTQFIVITHNRGTIEAADALYGVSMDAQGVSKVVSLRLADLDKERVG